MAKVRGGVQIATIGYEGYDPSSFVDALIAHRIEQVVDIRELPLSRKRGFSKTSLSARLQTKGIEYLHLRDLGAPRKSRHAYRLHRDFDRFARDYTSHLESKRAVLDDLKVRAHSARTVIMCVEADAGACHRGIVAEKLAAEGFAVVHVPKKDSIDPGRGLSG